MVPPFNCRTEAVRLFIAAALAKLNMPLVRVRVPIVLADANVVLPVLFWVKRPVAPTIGPVKVVLPAPCSARRLVPRVTVLPKDNTLARVTVLLVVTTWVV